MVKLSRSLLLIGIIGTLLVLVFPPWEVNGVITQYGAIGDEGIVYRILFDPPLSTYGGGQGFMRTAPASVAWGPLLLTIGVLWGAVFGIAVLRGRSEP